MKQGRLSQYRNFLKNMFSRESLDPLASMSAAAKQFRGALNLDLRRDALLTEQTLKHYPARLRQMNCLEYLLTSTFLQPVKDQEGPVDFFAVVLSAVNSHRDLLIYALTEQREPWQNHGTEDATKLRGVMREIEEDLVGRWQIQSVIHAHPMRHDHIAKITPSSLAPTEADRNFLHLNRRLFPSGTKWISLDYFHALELTVQEIIELPSQ